MHAAFGVNADLPPGKAKGRGSARASVGEEELQLTEHQVPILTPDMPVLDNSLGCQIEHSPQRIVVGKAGFVLGDLPELPVQALDDVGRVYDFPNLRRIFKEGAQNLPVVLPALDAGGILLAPGIGEPTQVFLRLVQSNGGIDLFQVGNNLLDVFIADIPGRAADLVDDAPLQTALGIDRPDGLHHAAQTVSAKQIHIQNTPAFEVIQHIQPKFAALMRPNPDPQDVLPTIHGDAQHHIGRLGHIPVIFLDLIVDGVHEHEGIDRFQRPVLPGAYFRHDFFTDFAHQLRGDLHIVQALDLLGNVPLTHSAGIQGKDFVFHALGVTVIFSNDFRLVVALPVPGHPDVDLSKLGLDRLLRIAVAVVGGAVFTACPLAPFPPQFLVHLHFHHLLDDVTEHLFHSRHDVRRAGEVLALNILLQ